MSPDMCTVYYIFQMYVILRPAHHIQEELRASVMISQKVVISVLVHSIFILIMSINIKF